MSRGRLRRADEDLRGGRTTCDKNTVAKRGASSNDGQLIGNIHRALDTGDADESKHQIHHGA